MEFTNIDSNSGYKIVKPKWKPIFTESPRHSLPGILVAFEGIDGSGKTTLIAELENYLRVKGVECLVIKAPSIEMRKYWAWEAWHESKANRENIDELGLTIMALGDRLVVQKHTIIPKLENGVVILADRYILSVLAYWGTKVHKFIAERLLAPDIGIYCSVTPETAIKRLIVRTSELKELHDYKLLKTLSSRYDKLISYYKYYRINTETVSIKSSINEITLLLDTIINY